MSLEYLLEFAGTPFLIDVAKVVRLPVHGQGEQDDAPGTPKDQLPPLKHQPLADLIDEIDRILPFKYLNDFKPPSRNPGRNLGAIAFADDPGPMPNPTIRIGDWFYPTGASRWSVFRGLATSAMVKAMLASTKGTAAKTFTMKVNPISPGNPANNATLYTLSSSMFMLPPRPIGEHGGTFDGLYLVTLVDERFYWASTPVSLRVTQAMTWASLISQIATLLGVTITHTTISAAYGQPEPDSQLWTNAESAPVLLDAIAHNVGRVVVRKLNGAYELVTPAESRTTVIANRGNVQTLVRTAGGDMFSSGTNLPVGSLFNSKNSIVPDNIQVTFPKYVRGNDPVPHFLNARYANQRPSCWYEESYGDAHTINVGISGGGSFASGVSGVVNDYTIHSTAKALYETEAAATGNPLNQSGLNSLAQQIAQDYYGWQLAAALDEVYPGTLVWTPEGIHDIVWTYSARSRGGFTRVLRAEWNQTVREMQHAAPPMSGQTSVILGVGGPSVPQTWRDSISGHTATLGQTLDSGSFTATLLAADNLPTQNRWKGRIDGEDILFEGTSGGLAVGIVYRGIDGTIQIDHGNASTVTEIRPHTIYGANLVTSEKMQWFFPGAHTSGGTQEIVAVPQTQTVRIFSASGQTMGGVVHYSGEISVYSPATGAFPSAELVWVRERNNGSVSSGSRYDGQFAGFSLSGPIAPVYLINVGIGGTVEGNTTFEGDVVFDGTATFNEYTTYSATSDALTGTQNNYNLLAGTNVLKITAATALTLTGLDNGVAGRLVWIENVEASAANVTIPNESGSSSAANQFVTPGDVDFVLTPGTMAPAIYNVTDGFWYLQGQVGGPGAGAIPVAGQGGFGLLKTVRFSGGSSNDEVFLFAASGMSGRGFHVHFTAFHHGVVGSGNDGTVRVLLSGTTMNGSGYGFLNDIVVGSPITSFDTDDIAVDGSLQSPALNIRVSILSTVSNTSGAIDIYLQTIT